MHCNGSHWNTLSASRESLSSQVPSGVAGVGVEKKKKSEQLSWNASALHPNRGSCTESASSEQQIILFDKILGLASWTGFTFLQTQRKYHKLHIFSLGCYGTSGSLFVCLFFSVHTHLKHHTLVSVTVLRSLFLASRLFFMLLEISRSADWNQQIYSALISPLKKTSVSNSRPHETFIYA